MAVNFLKDFYENIRNSLLGIMVYFILQSLVWIALAILIIMYPQSLMIIFAVVFCVFALLGFYFAFIFARYLSKLKKIKDAVVKFKF